VSVLAHTRVVSARPTERWMLFLPGILGTRANWRSFARAWVEKSPGWGALLVDLRMHGQSKGFAPPHGVEACAADLHELCHALGLSIAGVTGHSFGGKVALVFARARADLEQLWSIDSMPGPPAVVDEPGSPLRILSLLERLPAKWPRRDAFVDALAERGIERGVGNWLAMNLESENGGFRLALEVPAIRALIEDYLAFDAWPAIEQIARGGTRVHAVIAGRSTVWSSRDRERAQQLGERGLLRVHTMPLVGHWVHVEDPAGLLGIMAPADGLH
jgi:pimeloyl-ACP methyl ester carboxylesterase